MMQDCASANKIKENKYKILRMSLLLGSDDNREETLNNFEDAARDIDTMNDEIYLRDLEDKFYDTTTLEEEEKKLAVLVDYIGGRVEQRISLLRDFSNVTGFDLTKLPPIKYYDKLDDYKERLKYIREYLSNIEQITILTNEISTASDKLKDAYINKATYEEVNRRNEEICLSKFEKFIKNNAGLKDIDLMNIDTRLSEVIDNVEESKKSLDIFVKSFSTLRGSGISYEEEEEYKSYVENAKQVYYSNKEQEYLLKIYQYLLNKEEEYSTIIIKRQAINEIIYERMNLRKDLNIVDNDVLSNIYDLLDRQYEEIKNQKENIDNIENLNEIITLKKDEVNDLELDNQKVEILSLLREFGLIDTYEEEEQIPNSVEEEVIVEEKKEESNVFSNDLKEDLDLSFNKDIENNSIPLNDDIFSNNNISIVSNSPPDIEENDVKPLDNEVIKVEISGKLDLDLVHLKAEKVMQRVGEMLGIKVKNDTIVNVENKIEEEVPKEENAPSKVMPINPLFNNTIDELEQNKTDNLEHNFWFDTDSPSPLNDLPDLTSSSNTNFFESNDLPNLNFPDLKVDFNSSKEDGQ